MPKLTTIDFHGDTLFAMETSKGVLVVIKPISDKLGLDWSAQYRRTRRDPVLSEGIAKMATPSPGGAQETICLPLDLLPGWLFGISANQVKQECRDAVITYQRECYAALFQHFFRVQAAGQPMVGTPSEPSREEPVPVRRSLVTEARQTFGAKAAGSLWFALGLPIVPEMQEGGRQTDMGFTYTTAVRHDPPLDCESQRPA